MPPSDRPLFQFGVLVFCAGAALIVTVVVCGAGAAYDACGSLGPLGATAAVVGWPVTVLVEAVSGQLRGQSLGPVVAVAVLCLYAGPRMMAASRPPERPFLGRR